MAKAGAGRSSWRWRHYVRPQAYQRDMARDAKCWICGGAIDYAASNDPRDPTYSKDAWEPDHRLDVSLYPEFAEDITNIMPSHSRCNRRRAKKSRREKQRDTQGTASDFGGGSRVWL